MLNMKIQVEEIFKSIFIHIEVLLLYLFINIIYEHILWAENKIKKKEKILKN